MASLRNRCPRGLGGLSISIPTADTHDAERERELAAFRPERHDRRAPRVLRELDGVAGLDVAVRARARRQALDRDHVVRSPRVLVAVEQLSTGKFVVGGLAVDGQGVGGLASPGASRHQLQELGLDREVARPGS